MLSYKTIGVKFTLIFFIFGFLRGPTAWAKAAPTVGQDFQETVEIDHPNRQIHVGDFYHVVDVHGQQVGLIRVMRFDSDACIARVIEGEATFGSNLVKDEQMTADRNRRIHVRAVASVDNDSDKVGGGRPDESTSQVSSLDGEVTGWRAWTPITGWPMRKMIYLGISPSTSYISSSASASPNLNFGFTLGAAVEFMRGVKGFEVGLDIYQAGFNLKNSAETANLVLDYVGIPILFKYAVIANDDWQLRLKGGLTESFLVSSTDTVTSTAGSASSQGTQLSSTDTLVTVGADAVFPAANPGAMSYWAQVTFSYGLLNLNQGSFTGNVNNEVMNLSGGIFF